MKKKKIQKQGRIKVCDRFYDKYTNRMCIMEQLLQEYFYFYFFLRLVVDLTPVMFSGRRRGIACARHGALHGVRAELNALAFLFVRLKCPLPAHRRPRQFIRTRSRDIVLCNFVFFFYVILNVCSWYYSARTKENVVTIVMVMI